MPETQTLPERKCPHGYKAELLSIPVVIGFPGKWLRPKCPSSCPVDADLAQKREALSVEADTQIAELTGSLKAQGASPEDAEAQLKKLSREISEKLWQLQPWAGIPFRDDTPAPLPPRSKLDGGLGPVDMQPDPHPRCKPAPAPAVATSTLTEGDEAFLRALRAEILRARGRFPSSRLCMAALTASRLCMAALTEESGELAQAMLKVAAGKRSPLTIFSEAVQVAAMAMRVATEGDPSFTDYSEPG
jgi:hypothetical protein